MKKIFLKLLPVALVAGSSCGGDFLDIKQDQAKVVPNEVADYQALLDNYAIMNGNSSHKLGMLGGDEFYVTDDVWNAHNVPLERNAYLWAADVYERQVVDDWNNAYSSILYTNVVLDGLRKIRPVSDGENEWATVKGSALFLRGYRYFQLAQLFCKQFDHSVTETEMGLPLRLESDITLRSERSTLRDTYNQILSDLHHAEELLPLESVRQERPSKAAAYALLARIYLQIGDYDEALDYANRCLSIRSGLLDFKQLDLDRQTYNTFDVVVEQNPEMIFMANVGTVAMMGYGQFNADTALYRSYSETDLRKKAYFIDYLGTLKDRGSYCGNGNRFTGLAVDEVVLIKAEALVRTGNVSEGLAELNKLLEHRHDHGFQPLDSDDMQDVLGWVIDERKKELYLRGLRWSDLKRLNKETQFSTVLRRTINEKPYELTPDDLKYVWPIPDEVIEQAGISQNPR